MIARPARSAALAAVVAVAFAPAMLVSQVASAVVDARLDGGFHVTGTVKVDTLHPEYEGAKSKRDWKFTSTCKGSGACNTIKVDRLTGSGNHIKYTLKKKAKGTWSGSTSYQSSTVCTIDGDTVYEAKGKQTETMTVKVTKQAKGKASKVAGSLKIVFPALKAPITPAECEEFFADHGLAAGDHPIQKVDFVGNRA